MSLLLRRPWTRQPQTAVGIDWGNPITRGVVFAWMPATDQLIQSGAVGKTNNKQGVGIATNGTSTYEYKNSAPVFSLDDCSVTAILTPNNTNTASSCAVSAGLAASANPLFILGQSATSNRLEFRTRDIGNVDINVAGASADWQTGLTSVVAGTRSKSAALQRVFAAGKQVASGAVGTAAETTFDRFAIGCLLRSSAALFWNGTTNLVIIHNRALSESEIKSLSDNPWQIFAPITRSIWVPVAAGSGNSLVGVTPVDLANNAGLVAISQTHLVTIAAALQATIATAVAISQSHLVLSDPAINALLAAQVAILSGALTAIENAQIANAGTVAGIGQTHLLSAVSGLGVNSATPALISQAHLLQILDAVQINPASAAAVGGIVALTDAQLYEMWIYYQSVKNKKFLTLKDYIVLGEIF